MLELKNISKTYEGRLLLDDITFAVQAGETVCLLGASGSGKSTLLRMIAGLESPENGRILFDHIDLASTPAHLRDFGLVFQDYGLFPHLNIFDNIAFGLKMRKLPAPEINLRVTSLLKKMDLAGFEKRKVTDLSGGEQQRVALARALATRPRLLMFDEPLGALDRSLKEGLLKELRSILRKAGIPAIYVTHDQDEAFTLADRILLLHEGKIIRAGTPAEIWSNPGSAWAARFLNAGNVIEGAFVSPDKIKTAVGVFPLKCRHKHSKGQRISLLLKQSNEIGEEELRLKVEDVLFKHDQFEVRLRGGIIVHLKDAPKTGQTIRVRVRVRCLE
jgi:ABC-type Fe3+/spermidine/putrescine transport system ATPase subunit